jgi:hypothetical protein
MDDRLFDLPGMSPPARAVPTLSRAALVEARAAVRRARERGLTAVPTPSAITRSPAVSQAPGTVRATMPRGGQHSPLPAHGTRARYNHRRAACRCEACCAANTAYMARYRGIADRSRARVGQVQARAQAGA